MKEKLVDEEFVNQHKTVFWEIEFFQNQSLADFSEIVFVSLCAGNTQHPHTHSGWSVAFPSSDNHRP